MSKINLKKELTKDLIERFLRYVKINTQSEEGLEAVPSTPCQHDLAKILYDELKEMGIKNVTYDKKHCYVYAHIPANSKSRKNSIAFIAHMDTSPESPGSGVKPVVRKNYDGKIIKFEGNKNLTLSIKESPQLKDEIGHDIITTDGTTLLGADDKAGVAEIMTALKVLTAPDNKIEHCDIYIVFTPDEEVGNGTAHFDFKLCKAKYGFTLDGEDAGELNCETFNARGATIEFFGVNTHPGTAYERMQNTLYPLADLLKQIPKSMKPETTKDRKGFFHPLDVDGTVEHSKIKMIIRDFDASKMDAKCAKLKEIVAKTQAKYKGVKIDLHIKDQYQNMGVIIKKNPKIMELAEKATEMAGLKPFYKAIRGGTDGARLTFMGMPTLNLFSGMFNCHSKNEWASIRTMEFAVKTILNIANIA